MPKYVTLEKAVGQTPLECVEAWRDTQLTEYKDIPLAYAGRLDPMASGKLLILLGDECKVQEKYHNLDKEYEFSVLFGVGSDTGDVLGRLQFAPVPEFSENKIKQIAKSLVGHVNLPYPHFSSKTVKGKPLHVWTLEGRLNEITIPTKESDIYKLKLTKLEQKTREEIYKEVSKKIETIKPVTESSKALGNDFRRVDVRADWLKFKQAGANTDTFYIAKFSCIASSGTYMRTLAEIIGRDLGTNSLAYHIHRTIIGKYQPLPLITGFWLKQF
jgi:tRNA pseudouridine(55) synthase